MTKCFFCGKEENPHCGISVADSITGKVKYFCSHKCRANSEMGRRKKKWATPVD